MHTTSGDYKHRTVEIVQRQRAVTVNWLLLVSNTVSVQKYQLS